jgi:hypothetical protein
MLKKISIKNFSLQLQIIIRDVTVEILNVLSYTVSVSEEEIHVRIVIALVVKTIHIVVSEKRELRYSN